MLIAKNEHGEANLKKEGYGKNTIWRIYIKYHGQSEFFSSAFCEHKTLIPYFLDNQKSYLKASGFKESDLLF